MSAIMHLPGLGKLTTRTQALLRGPFGTWELSQEALALVIALFFSLWSNAAFFRVVAAFGAFDGNRGAVLALCMFVAITALNMVMLLLLMTRWSSKPVLTVLLLVTALASHYTSRFTVYMDADMIRNFLHTDAKESAEYISSSLILSLLAFGILPSILVWRTRFPKRSLGRAVFIRIASILAALLIAAAAILGSYQGLASLMRNHREVRYLILPGSYLASLGSVWSDSRKSQETIRTPIGLQAKLATRPPGSKPRLLVIIVGETVRAQNWGLNGYTRQTTPQLARIDSLVNFTDTTACGSATEVSLPCMFSPIGRRDYDGDRIKHSESLLHLLDHVGIRTLWRDNQTGCKGVCEGLPFESFEHATRSAGCSAEGCLDEVMLQGLDEKVENEGGDMVLVLHQLGNHGPAYFRRYPSRLAKYLPACESAELIDCKPAEIVNAYDNAVLYTDEFIAQTIRTLGAMSTRDTALIYVSDHGESLGENGLYLHGIPYAIAPDTQIKVPMAIWLSPGMLASRQIALACLRSESKAPASHDNLFHSVLGLLRISAPEYVPQLDLFRNCMSANSKV